ncbi:MAG: tRNA (N(6)-L-threonylcarbamoyladenosine(37)-C(2))-methylthiotransferase MtaB [Candidatus Kapabacteria bacterium]|nr:tRNA (N(6)-L-threonylcarbamoyladenosine(37)-C(2))-methylthiotransferase MtaB [Candidatus Kapabacteria bacterium]
MLSEDTIRPLQRVAITTLGCKLNYAESAALHARFVERGFTVVAEDVAADVIVVNTCTVTDAADAECRKIVRRHLRTSPDAIVAVTGCFAQLQPESIASIDGVRGVFGTAEKLSLPDRIAELQTAASPRIYVRETSDMMDFAEARSVESDGRTRAFVKVQDGCDYNCSFCTIPLARGGSRAMPFEALCRELDRLDAERFREVILTGVNLGEFKASSGERFVDVLRYIASRERSYRVRVSSIEPNTISDEIIDVVSTNSVFCPHVHTPLQSGSPDVLRRMRRRYTTERYRDRIMRLHDRVPGLAIGIDVIVGFPGETQDHFEETVSFLASLPWTYLHVFTYSERPNTPAATYPDAVPMSVRRARTARLRAMSDERRLAHARRSAGDVREVVTESYDADRQRWIGWTDNYVRVAVDLPFATGRSAVRVRLGDVIDDTTVGMVDGFVIAP